MTLETVLRRVEYRDTGAREVYDLTYARGGDEALVTVTDTGDAVDAACEELPADTFHDEFVLEELGETFVAEHGSGFGEVGSL